MNYLQSWIKENRWLLFIFLLGASIRLLLIGVVPPGLNQDEASIGYDAYAVLHYGMDRNGIHNPVHFISWGSGQNALYGYLSMPFIYLFGLTPLSVRAASILFGIIGLIVFYILFRRIHQHKLYALLGMLLLAISPWHIMMSRWALESNLFPSLVLIGVLCLYVSFNNNKWFPVACFVFALSLYAYGTSYFFIPVFMAITAGYALYYKKLTIKTLLIGASVFVASSAPIFLFVMINRFKLDYINFGLFTIPRLTGTPRFDQISSVFQSDRITGAYENFKSFIVMFLKQDDGLIWNALPPYGFLYFFCIPLLLIGLGKAIVDLKQRTWNASFIMLAWFATAVLMAFITDVNINRMNVIYFPSIYFVAYGVWTLKGRFSYTYIPIVTAFIICFVGFTNDYFTKFPEKASASFYESLGDALHYATSHTEGEIEVTNSINMPYIFALFYEKTDPNVFQETVQYLNPDGPFQWVSSFGRYHFGDSLMHDTGISAYVIPNSDIAKYDTKDFHLKSFKHYSVALRFTDISGNVNPGEDADKGDDAESADIGNASSDDYASSKLNIVANASFELGDSAWTFAGSSGIATNRPLSGQQLAYLDAGSENRLSQQFLIDQAGTYDYSAYVSAGGAGAILGVKVNDAVYSELAIANEFSYHLLSQQLSLHANDRIELYVVGGEGWVNVDDFSFIKIE